MKRKVKPIIFHSSHKEQRQHGQMHSIRMNDTERWNEMYRLNRKLYGANYGRVSKTTELYVGLPGESLEDFYLRINNG